MRIGMFSTTLPETHLKPGGVDVLIERLCNQLVTRGHTVRMHSFSPAPSGFRADHVKLEPDRWRRSPPFRMAVAPLIFSRMNVSDLDVVHLHGEDWFYARRSIPTIRTFYGSARAEARTATSIRRRASQSLFFGLEVLASRLATATYGLIPGDGRVYRTVGALGCGIDMAPDASTERHPAPAILFVGTWSGRKRGHLVADAFAEHVLPSNPDAELWMVSDEAPATPGVTHFSRPSDAEITRLYQRAWVFCLPSSYEGFGIPYLEAMAAGTAVVATPNPGAEHLLAQGRYGRIVEDGQIGVALAELIDDGDLRAALGDLGRERAKAFSWDRVVAAHEAAYADAIARRRRS